MTIRVIDDIVTETVELLSGDDLTISETGRVTTESGWAIESAEPLAGGTKLSINGYVRGEIDAIPLKAASGASSPENSIKVHIGASGHVDGAMAFVADDPAAFFEISNYGLVSGHEVGFHIKNTSARVVNHGKLEGDSAGAWIYGTQSFD